MDQRTMALKKKDILFLVLVIVLSLSLGACKEKIKPGQSQVRRPEIKGVTIATVAPSKVQSFYETSGTVRAKVTSVLASRVFGTVTEVHVKEGDRVRPGELLVSIDDRDGSARVKAAESARSEALKAKEAAEKQSSLADITYKRYANLHEEKVVTGQEFDQVGTQRKVANLELERASLAAKRSEALLEEAKVVSGFTRVRAPFSGLVTAKKVERGSMAVPGTVLVTLEDVSHFKVEAYVDERLSPTLRKGQSIEIRLGEAKERVPAVITRVVPSVDPASRTFTIEAELQGSTLRSGLYAKVFIPDGSRDAIVVPLAAIVEKGQLTGVYTVDEKGVVAYRLIRTGKAGAGGVEVLSGLAGGERIIVPGADKAVDGGIVTDRQREARQ